MSAVINQPLPFGRLEREKHIHMVFRAFHNRCGPSCECQTKSTPPKSHQTPPDLEFEEQLSGQTAENGLMQPPVIMNRSEKKWEKTGRAVRSCFMSVLETASEIHITAKPELQGEEDYLFLLYKTGLLLRCVCVKKIPHPDCRSSVCF